MEAKIYLQYSDYNDDLFSMKGDYYKNDQEYMDAMTEDYNKNKDIVTNSVLDMLEGSGSLYSGVDGNTYVFGQKTPQKEEKYSYAKCDCVIFNENGEDETVDSLISNMVSQQPTVYMFELDMGSTEEEFEEELRMWVNEHNGITQYSNFYGDDWVFANEPTRNVRISFQNKRGDEINMILVDCKILDILHNSSYILYIERIEMLKDIKQN